MSESVTENIKKTTYTDLAEFLIHQKELEVRGVTRRGGVWGPANEMGWQVFVKECYVLSELAKLEKKVKWDKKFGEFTKNPADASYWMRNVYFRPCGRVYLMSTRVADSIRHGS